MRTTALVAVALALASGCATGSEEAGEPYVEVMGVSTIAPARGDSGRPSSDTPADLVTTPSVAGPVPNPTAPTASGRAASAPTETPAPARPRVAVVGDSLTHTASEDLVDALRAVGWDPVSVDGHPGAPIADRLGRIRELIATEDLDAIVLALGSNDARLNVVTGRDAGEAWAGTQSAAFTALADAQPVPCVIWVGVNANPSTWELNRWGAWFNAWLRYYATYADWTAFSAGQGDWFLEDDVHLTSAGNQAYAQLVAHTLVTSCDPGS